jgi:hypothetical protein
VAVADAELLERTRDWVAVVHPHARHLLRTQDWLLEIEPDAGIPLQIAALTHDIERAFPPEDRASVPRAMAPEYNDWHQDRSMRVSAAWLADEGAPAELIAEVSALVRVHEDGGWTDADLLQAADSLSFLEVQVELFAGLVLEGQLSAQDAEEKFQWMYDRIRIPRAKTLAAPMLDGALARLADTLVNEEDE